MIQGQKDIPWPAVMDTHPVTSRRRIITNRNCSVLSAHRDTIHNGNS